MSNARHTTDYQLTCAREHMTTDNQLTCAHEHMTTDYQLTYAQTYDRSSTYLQKTARLLIHVYHLQFTFIYGRPME